MKNDVNIIVSDCYGSASADIMRKVLKDIVELMEKNKIKPISVISITNGTGNFIKFTIANQNEKKLLLFCQYLHKNGCRIKVAKNIEWDNLCEAFNITYELRTLPGQGNLLDYAKQMRDLILDYKSKILPIGRIKIITREP